jgi:hypothetical protein
VLIDSPALDIVTPMRTFDLLSFSLLIFMLSSVSVFANGNTTELADYTAIQSLLSNGKFQGVPDASKKLSVDAKANHHAAIAEKADQLALTTDLKSARDAFVPLSKEMLPLAKADHSKTYQIVYCPMKKARWVQKSGPVANPFYDGEMKECGVKE